MLKETKLVINKMLFFSSWQSTTKRVLNLHLSKDSPVTCIKCWWTTAGRWIYRSSSQPTSTLSAPPAELPSLDFQLSRLFFRLFLVPSFLRRLGPRRKFCISTKNLPVSYSARFNFKKSFFDWVMFFDITFFLVWEECWFDL